MKVRYTFTLNQEPHLPSSFQSQRWSNQRTLSTSSPSFEHNWLQNVETMLVCATSYKIARISMAISKRISRKPKESWQDLPRPPRSLDSCPSYRLRSELRSTVSYWSIQNWEKYPLWARIRTMENPSSLNYRRQFCVHARRFMSMCLISNSSFRARILRVMASECFEIIQRLSLSFSFPITRSPLFRSIRRQISREISGLCQFNVLKSRYTPQSILTCF